ncbi:signal recognition particle subunit SRP72-like [Telopea speciosissima]|uniref:signal recognition particle subunit SRP72-like n=1 Tax=Telopea speciosissima TaxID=54955 RepID=UPI001CC4ACFE|nr:signal recognition particle subunit SRP72-like [Telopea speciosissima]
MAPKTKEKPKPSSSSPSQAPAAIEDLFSSLNRHIQRSEYELAVKVAGQVIAINPGDEDALRCKIVALIKADSIDRALSTIQDSEKAKIPIDFSFFKAYCLYRQNKLEEALDSLKSQERNSTAMLLESQILYRLGRMGACMDVYQKLQKFKIDSLEINIVAGLILAGRASEVQGTMDALRVKPTSSFELAYNTACSLIEKKQYTDAEHHLLSARRIGQETLMEDNWADDEIETELAPISVQLAYVRQLLGHPQEAIEAYTDIISRNLADDSSLAVAINNLISLKGPKDVSDGLRKLDRLIEKGNEGQSFQLARGLDLKLSSKQREAIYTNRVRLLLHANKLDQARELVAALPVMFPDSVMPILLQAAVLVRENKPGKAEEILGQFSDRFPVKSRMALLSRAQVAAAASHPQIAAESLARITDIQHMPATVATLVALKERAGDIDGAAAVLDSAINWWSNAMAEDNKLNIIMPEAASFKLKHGREEEAANLYEELVKSHGSVEALVGLVTTAARVDVEKAEVYEKQLKPLAGLKGVDVESLERTSGATQKEGGGRVVNIEAYEEAKGKVKAKKKRKRKPKYPKGFDPANPGPPPDPERWLPKRERSSYRPKRKDKRAAQVRGSQGAVVREKHEASAVNTNSNILNSKSSQTAASSSKGPSNNANSEQSKPTLSKSSRKKSRN